MERSHPTSDFKTFESNVVTEELRKVAEAELHERDDETGNSVQILKELLKTEEKNLVPCLDDDFLIMFLRARKFNTQAAFSLLKKYYQAPVKYPSMFTDFNPRSCMNAIKAQLHYFLPYRSPDGCPILLSKFGQWDPKTLSCKELLKFNIMCNEMAIQNPVTQISGIITIADMKNFSWSHLLQISITEVQCFVNTLQNCLPVRDKAIHIIHHSSIFSILFALVKPLLSEKVQNRIFFHGDDLNSLHLHLPPEILPKSLGGQLSDLPNEEFLNSLLSSDEDFKTRHSYGYVNNI